MQMIGSLGHNRMVNDRFLVVFSNRGQWNVGDYPFDKRTLRLVMSIKDGHPMQQQYKFTFTAFSPSYLYSSYNRNFDFFIKGFTLQNLTLTLIGPPHQRPHATEADRQGLDPYQGGPGSTLQLRRCGHDPRRRDLGQSSRDLRSPCAGSGRGQLWVRRILVLA